MGFFYLLDVASGPIYLVLGIGLLLIVGVIAALTYFAIKAIQSIKTRREQDVDHSDN